ncbi:PASTA domain-containing protein, partial [Streptomyces sp. NPDC006475]
KASKGATITLKVSKGPQQPTGKPVPEVRTQRLGQAKQILAQNGFTNLALAPGSPGDDNAIVTSLDPQPGTQVDPATTTITLTTIGGGGGNGGNNGGGNGGFIGGGDGD